MDDDERHEAERRSLFGNEQFLIGVLQAVSAGTAFGILSQFGTIIRYAGRGETLIALTMLVAALALAVVAALCRHHYRMWNLKALSMGNRDQRDERLLNADKHLGRMRQSMELSTLLIIGALATLIISMWVSYFIALWASYFGQAAV